MNENTRPADIQSHEGNAKCPECGSSNLMRNQKEYKFPYGKGTEAVELSAMVEVEKCGDCGFSSMGPAAEQACHDAICDHLGLMKPDQIKGLRDYCKLTQAEFSKITGLGEATLSRWERGIVIQNEAYDNYLYLLGLGENLQNVRERRESSMSTGAKTKIAQTPQFRELDVNEEVLQRRDKFKLHRWELVR